MKHLFLILIFSIFLFNCYKKLPIAEIKFEKITHRTNKNGYDIYDLYLSSNLNLDSLEKKEKRPFHVFCSLDNTITDINMKNMNTIRFSMWGNLDKDSIDFITVSNIHFMENIDNGTKEKELNKKQIKNLLIDKECIQCKIYNGGYIFKSPYYSKAFCIPAKDISDIL